MYSHGVSRPRLAALVLGAVLAALLPAAPASAASASATLCTGVEACRKAGYSDFGYGTANTKMYWNMFSGANCTNYAAYRLITSQGVTSTRPWTGSGNAKNWGVAMSSYLTQTPTVGSIAWFPDNGSAGHVAYVEKVGTKSIIISESSWGGPMLRWRQINRADSARWPKGFLVMSLPNLAKPTVSGTVKVGATLNASTITPAPKVAADSITYRWQADGKSISGAGAQSFKPTQEQLNKSLAVRVVVKRGTLETSTLYSAASRVLPGSLATTVRPTFSGTARVDQVVRATSGTWNVPGTTFRYQWMADGKPIPGATSPTLTVPGSAAGKKLTVAVSASRAAYSTTTVSSAAVAVPFGTLTVKRPAAVKGGGAVGATATADAAFSRDDVTVRYAWTLDGVAIPGATGRTYTPRAQDRGKRLAVVTTASRSGYVDVSSTSVAGPAIVNGTMRRTTPTLRGTPAVGRDLAVNGLSWAPGARYQYRWLADGRVVSGATTSRLTLTPQLRGKRISVQVTGTATGYDTASATSAATVRVAYGTVSASVTVKGTAKVRGKLKATVAVKRPTSGQRTIRYQWLRDGRTIKGATKSTYRLTTADRRHRVSVKVTVSSSGYTTKKITSRRTGTVR